MMVLTNYWFLFSLRFFCYNLLIMIERLPDRPKDGAFKFLVGNHVEHGNSTTYIEAMKIAKASRLFVLGVSSGFVSAEGEAHCLHFPFTFNQPRIDHRVLLAAQSLNIKIVDGFIRTHDHTGQIYQIFSLPMEYQAGFPSEEAAKQALATNYDQWLEAANEAATNPEAYIQYYDQNAYLKNHSQMVDLTVGNQHYVINLQPNWEVKSLQDVQQEFPRLRMQDNTAIYDWGRVLFKGDSV